jgi:NADH-quinone oxidoreductase subunit N
MEITLSQILDQLPAAAPANLLLLGGLLLLSIAALPQSMRTSSLARDLLGWTAIGFCIAACWAARAIEPSGSVVGSLFQSDAIRSGGSWLAALVGIPLILLAWHRMDGLRIAEHLSMVLLMLSGLAYTASASDLVSLFLGLELVSLPTTILLAMTRRDGAGREATLKYFTLAAFSSAVFLFGLSYLYGIAGDTSLAAVGRVLGSPLSLMGWMGWGFVLAGLAFRMTAVPFHFYAPDVFCGTKLPMAAGLAVVPKIAGFLALMRLLDGGTRGPEALSFSSASIAALSLLAVLTMTVGNVLAMVQKDFRRWISYSSVAHTGYLLLGVAAIARLSASWSPILFYLGVYAAMTIGLLAVWALDQGDLQQPAPMDRWNGLAYRSPRLALAGSVALLSMTGVPLTAGFWGKFQIFSSTIASSDWIVRAAAIAMAINAVIAASYYLGVIWRFFEPAQETNRPRVVAGGWAEGGAVVLCTVLTIFWFLFP